jgi:DNA-binding GntR family transcriptional regulator
MSTGPLPRVSVVDTLAGALRTQILDGALPAGTPLRELELAAGYDVSRHTLRAALRALAAEGLVTLEANRGARVASLDREQLLGLLELRTALELEGAHLALARGEGRLPPTVHRALERLTAASSSSRPSWRLIAARHADLHAAIVDAGHSPRISQAYAALAGELRLYLLHLQPVWPLERMIEHHEVLVSGLERSGTEVLRTHLEEGRDAVLAAFDEELSRRAGRA